MVLESVALWEVLLALVLFLLVLGAVVPRVVDARRTRRRRKLLRRLGIEQGTKVLALVHGKAPLSFLGRPVYEIIDEDDAEAVLRGIREAGDKPLDLLVHTPGGHYTAIVQIARALRRHPARTRVLVPHMALSGGTVIALAADEIVMDPSAVLGPVDPQVGDLLRGTHSVVQWSRVAQAKGTGADDATLAFAQLGETLLDETRHLVLELVQGKVEDPEPLVARMVLGGATHAHPVGPDEARALGLPVDTRLPRLAHDVLATYRREQRRTVESA